MNDDVVEFEWDEEKRHANIRKHSLDFRRAIEVFVDRAVVTLRSRQAHGEERFVSGTAGGRIVAVVHTRRGGLSELYLPV
jgi:uncharacterized protein